VLRESLEGQQEDEAREIVRIDVTLVVATRADVVVRALDFFAKRVAHLLRG
jgi:hypothetical protein